MTKLDPSFTLAHASSTLERQGFTNTLVFENGVLHCRENGKRYHPAELVIVNHYRAEGASDPDDMSIIYAIEASDGTKATLTDAFGTYADPKLAAIIEKIEIREHSPSS